jgi:ESS family glutamate:Na+ symporter
MTEISVDRIEMLAISIVVLYVGVFLNRKIRFLADNFIPAAVTGGLLFSVLVLIGRDVLDVSLDFDMQLRDLLLLVFFSTVGLSVRFETLKTGGRTLLLLVIAAGIFLFLQNSVSVGIALLLGADPVYGLMAGSISFAGGHGTAIAWGSEFEASGLENASSIGLAFATFGLVAGGLVGGPIARRLIKRFHVDTTPAAPEPHSPVEHAQPVEEVEQEDEHAWLFSAMLALLLLALCVSLGEIVNHFISGYGLMLPGFLTAMFVGILISNLIGVLKQSAARQTIDRFGTVSLQIFLAMSMMTVQLWTLGGALRAIVLVLIAQVLLMTAFAMLVVFFVAGRDYDAVVSAAGFSGLGLGATPVAIAHLNAVTTHYGPSPKALLLVPLVGAFFIDLLNAGTIQFFLRVLH